MRPQVLSTILPLILSSTIACTSVDDRSYSATSEHFRTPSVQHEFGHLFVKQAKRSEEIASVGKAHHALATRQLVYAKLFDRSTLRIREVVVDSQTGELVDEAQVAQAARLAWQDANGAQTPELVHLLATIADSQAVPVQIWAEPDTVRELVHELGKLGAVVKAQEDEDVFAEVTAEQVRRIARLPSVKLVTSSERQALSLNLARDVGHTAFPAQNGSNAWVRSAIWEGGACIRRNHPDFRFVRWEPRIPDEPCDIGSQAGHSTKVTGVFAAYRSNSEKAGMWRGKIFDVDRHGASWITTTNAQIVNASWTISNLDGRHIDRAAYEKGVMLFNGSSNSVNGPAQCWAYNALCVGGYSHERTYGEFADDEARGSSYLNVYDGREVPQVVGPYFVDKTASTGTYAAESGTSYASPAVAALGALMLNEFWILFENPALMRAVLMASAQAHKISGHPVPDFNDEIDDRAGAGAPNGERARAILTERKYTYKTLAPADLGLRQTITLPSVTGGQNRLRLVLTWDQCPDYATEGRELFVDLDMIVEGPDGQVWSNLSRADNYEIVEFLAPTPGEYKVHLSAPKFRTCSPEGGQQRVRSALAWTYEPVAFPLE